MSADLYELVIRMGRLLQAQERGEGNLPPVQWHALLYLDRCNRYSDHPSAITDYLGVTKGTSSQTLKALEQKGLLSKTPDGDDGRVVHLKLTTKGRRAVRTAIPPKLWRESADRLSGANLKLLSQLLTQILQEMQRANGHRSFGVCYTCRHFQKRADEHFRCGLTGDILHERESEKLCREHELVDA